MRHLFFVIKDFSSNLNNFLNINYFNINYFFFLQIILLFNFKIQFYHLNCIILVHYYQVINMILLKSYMDNIYHLKIIILSWKIYNPDDFNFIYYYYYYFYPHCLNFLTDLLILNIYSVLVFLKNLKSNY